MGAGVLVVGSFNVDHAWTLDALPVPGETRSARYASGPGGKGFNQAVAAARSGAATRFVCALGDDAGGQLARALAVADGIDLRDAIAAAPTGSAGIFVDAAGRNSIAVAAGANALLGAAHVEHEFGGDAGVVLVQLETPSAAASRALELGRAAGATTVLNPAPADAPTTPSLIALADVLTPNETEFAALLARHGGGALDPNAVAGSPDEVLHARCRALAPEASVVVTLGAAGCFVSHPPDRLRGDAADRYRMPALAVKAIDTTGAGDAFNGALCASLANAPGRPFAEHVRRAGAYASVSTERTGAALAMPLAAEVEQRLAAG
ncbi:ribokinase [Lysobacter humi (ex Lee et al. 2017)]